MKVPVGPFQLKESELLDASLLPEPDSELGYSEQHLSGILGDRMADFRDYMLMKTYAVESSGRVYYPHDVHLYVEYHVPPRAARPTLAQVDAIFQA